MYRDIEVLRLLPDRQGRGGTKFGYHSFQQTPINDTRDVKNVHVWQDSWRSDLAGRAFALYSYFPDESVKDAGSGAALALHGYTKFSSTDPSVGPMTEMIGHNVASISGVPTGYLWNYNSWVDWTILPGPVLQWDINLMGAASATHPAVFANIGNRCFIGTGIGEALVYDSSRGGDVFANGSGQPHVYTLGIDAPTAAPIVSAADVALQTAVYVREGSKYLSWGDPNGGLATAAHAGADNINLTANGTTWSGATSFDIYAKATVFDTAEFRLTMDKGTNIAQIDRLSANAGTLLNPSFASDLSNWTHDASWTWDAGSAKHTAGTATALTQTITLEANTNYYVYFTISGWSAGYISVDIGGVVVGGAGTTYTAAPPYFIDFVSPVATPVTFTITPNAAFDGKINYIDVTKGMSNVPSNAWVGLTLTINGVDFTVMATGKEPLVGEIPNISADVLNVLLRGGPHGNGVYSYSQDLVTMPFTLTGVRWTMERAGLDVAWNGPTTSEHMVTGQMINTGGRLTWASTPPSYAYAWYDPLTGHVSNISPVFSPDATTVTDVGVRVNVDVGNISYPEETTSIPAVKTPGGSSPFPRWTHILFFRTLMNGGSTLYPIGSLIPMLPDPNDPGNMMWNPEWRGLPNNIVRAIPPTTTGNYWYDSARDSELLVSGALRAPQFTNGKPKLIQNGQETVLYPSHLAYWDGRLWLSGTQDPAALHYSCDRVQCPFGVPEESFPDTNVLRIPASDGCVRGMKLIGESLLITTERWAYTIAGNNESNYRLVRVSTRMAGVGDYQMDEFTPDVEGQQTLVVFLGTDSRVYAMPLGGQAVWISKEIQTVLDAANLQNRTQYNYTRVHCMSIAGRRVALVYVQDVANNSGRTFLYDFDTKVWTESTFASDASTTNTGQYMAWSSTTSLTKSMMEIYAVRTNDVTPPIVPYQIISLRQYLDTSVTVPIPSGHVRTFPLNFDGKKTRKQLHFVRIYVNHPSQLTFNGLTPVFPWRIRVRENSSATNWTATPIVNPDFSYNLLGGTLGIGADPVDSATAAELVTTGPALTTDGRPLLGYTFDVEVLFPDQVDRIYQLYALEIGYSTVSEAQVDP